MVRPYAVFLSPGKATLMIAEMPMAAANATIPSKESADLADLLARGAVLLNDADGTIKEVGGKLNRALDGVSTTVSNVNDVVVALKDGHGAVGMLLSDDEFANQIRQRVTMTLSDAQEIVAAVKDAEYLEFPCGHLSNVELPEPLAKAIVTFLCA